MFQRIKSLFTDKGIQSITCKCSACGKEKKIFADEMDRAHKCICGANINYDKTQLTGRTGAS